MSRIVYQSITLSGRLVPTSAFILWPLYPRLTPLTTNKVPLVVWAHGTSGLFAENAHSHFSSLGLPFQVAFPLVQNGYAVLAPDYAGIGVPVDGNGEHVAHEYFAFPAHADDLIHGAAAAKSAFPQLSTQFVVIGMSQGGGAAWSVAQHHAHHHIAGYLGAVALSPVTDILELASPGNSYIPLLVALMAGGIAQNSASFTWEEIVTDEAMERYRLWEESQGAVKTGLMLMGGDYKVARDDWTSNIALRQYVHRTANGSRPIAGPLLVIHGEDDAILFVDGVERAVRRTKEKYPNSDIKFTKISGTGHDALPFAAQPLWMEWIGALFEGKGAEANRLLDQPRPSTRRIDAYKRDLDFHVERASKPWHLGN